MASVSSDATDRTQAPPDIGLSDLTLVCRELPSADMNVCNDSFGLTMSRVCLPVNSVVAHSTGDSFHKYPTVPETEIIDADSKHKARRW